MFKILDLIVALSLRIKIHAKMLLWLDAPCAIHPSVTLSACVENAVANAWSTDAYSTTLATTVSVVLPTMLANVCWWWWSNGAGYHHMSVLSIQLCLTNRSANTSG